MQDASIVARLRAAGCVFAEEEARLIAEAAPTGADLELLLERREAGTPLEYVVGWARFCGLRIAVQPGVFVPRRRSEFLARQATRLVRTSSVVVDMCCGSAAIAAAVVALSNADERACALIFATDIDPVAVRCAKGNLPGDRVYLGDLFEAVPTSLRGQIDVLVANAPYVPTDEIPLLPAEARNHEPSIALDGGHDGLDVHRRISAEAPDWLATGGYVLLETTEAQASTASKILSLAQFDVRVDRDDELGATVVIGRKRPIGQ